MFCWACMICVQTVCVGFQQMTLHVAVKELIFSDIFNGPSNFFLNLLKDISCCVEKRTVMTCKPKIGRNDNPLLSGLEKYLDFS